MSRARCLSLGLPLAFLLAAASHAETLGGRVFHDLDGDGRAGPDEPGIAGVRVSNGRDVTLTDDRGAYELEVNGDSIVFISKPAGYMTPLNAYRLPRFYYLHRPNGSPAGLRYAGIKPTGPLPERIDFALYRQEEPASFEAILFADTQPQTEEELDYIRDGVVSELVGTDAAFGMTMGDILFDDLSMFPRYNSIIATLGIPWYNVAGNHELNQFAPSDDYSLETFSNWYGPPYYAFEYANAVFVVLDDVRYRGAAPTPENPRAGGGYDAALGEAQLAWLEAELAHVPHDRLLVLAMHIPLMTRSDPRGVEDRQALFDLLTDYPNLYAMAGHTHTTQHIWIGEEDGYRGEAGVPSPRAHHRVGELVERALRRGGAARLHAARRNAQGLPPHARRRHGPAGVLQGRRASRRLPDAHHARRGAPRAGGRLSRLPARRALRRPHQRRPGRRGRRSWSTSSTAGRGRPSGSRSTTERGRTCAGCS